MALQIVFTGRAVDARGVFHHRNALFTACDEIGWTVRNQVDSSTSVLVASEDVGDTKKVRDARRMGVQVRDYAWFFAHLNAERQARTDHARAQRTTPRVFAHTVEGPPRRGQTVEVRPSDGVRLQYTGELRIEVAPEQNRSSFDRGVTPQWIDLMALKPRYGGVLRETLEQVEHLSSELNMRVDGRITGGADTAAIRLRAYSGPCPLRDEAHLFAMYDLVPGRMRAEMAGLLASRRDAEHVPEPVPYVRKTVRRGIS